MNSDLVINWKNKSCMLLYVTTCSLIVIHVLQGNKKTQILDSLLSFQISFTEAEKQCQEAKTMQLTRETFLRATDLETWEDSVQ